MTIDNVGELSGILVAVFGLLGLLYRYLLIPLKKLTVRLKSNSKEIFTSLPVLFAISRKWPLLPEAGSLVGDIDSLKAKLSRSEHFARAVFQDCPYGIFRCNIEGKNIEVNRTYCRWLGVGENELLGHKWRTFLVGESVHDNYDDEWREAFSQGREVEFSIELRTSSFKHLRFYIHAYPIFDHKNEVVEYVGLMKKAEEGDSY